MQLQLITVPKSIKQQEFHLKICQRKDNHGFGIHLCDLILSKSKILELLQIDISSKHELENNLATGRKTINVFKES